MATYPDYDALLRFELIHGQYFDNYKYKNLWWELDGDRIGFGDLRDEDISRISEKLNEGEEFIGWHENHDSKFQQTNTPMIRISFDKVILRDEIEKTEGR